MKRIHTGGAVLLMSILLSSLVFPAWAEEVVQSTEAEQAAALEQVQDTEPHIYPLVKYDFASLDSQGIHSPGAGLLLMNDKLMLLGFYTRHAFTEPLQFDYPEVYHSVDLL